MKLSFIIAALEEFAPRALQESWDNSGLQIGLPEGTDECTGALLCVDVTEETIAEAVGKGFNLVISHHPLIFKGFRQLTGATAPQRAAMAAIRAGVAVYSAHTSLDSAGGGVSYAMASVLGAKVAGVLSPSEAGLSKITVFCPRAKAQDVRLTLLDNGGDSCRYADADAETLSAQTVDPTLGIELLHTPLTRVETIVPAYRAKALAAAVAVGPEGEKMKVEISAVEKTSGTTGLGVVADFDKPVTMSVLLAMLKERFGVPAVHANLAYSPDAPVRRVALCGGAGGEFIGRAKAVGADAYVTADIRYHDFCDNRIGMAIFDIGHFESEQFATEVIAGALSREMPSFPTAIAKSQINPVKYL